MVQNENVSLLVDRSRNAKHWSVDQMLADALSEVVGGKRLATKAIVVFLDDTEGKYDTGFSQSGMSLSQCVALLEIAKADLVKKLSP